MFCAKCCARLEENAKFCNKCGSPVLAAADGGQAAGEGKKPGKVPLAAVLILAVVLTAGIGIFTYRATHKEAADISEAVEKEDSPAEEVQLEAGAEEPEEADEKAEILAILENISYYGDKSRCAMTAEQAEAYAQLIADGLAGKAEVPEYTGVESVPDVVFWDQPYEVVNTWGYPYLTDRANIMLADFAGDGNPYLYIYSSLAEASFEVYGWNGSAATLAANWEGNDGRVRAYVSEDSDGTAKMFVLGSSGVGDNSVEIYSFSDGTAEISYTLEVRNEGDINHCIENGVDTIYSTEDYDIIYDKMKKVNPELWEGDSDTIPAVWFYEGMQPSTLSEMMEGLNQYVAGMSGEEREVVKENTEDHAELAKEAVLEQYRQFLQGDLTAEYEGSPVTLDEFYEAILRKEGLESIYDFSAPNMGRYALTDTDMNGLPELQITPSITEYWLVYTAESVDGKLKITEVGGINGSWGILYHNGLIQSGDGMHTSGHYDWFTNLQGGRIACFAYLYDEDGYEVMDSFIEEESETAYKEGYEQVYITHGEENGSSREEYDHMVSDFAAEHGGEEAQFHSLEEMLHILPVPDTSAQAESPWLIRMKNCTIDVDLSACVPAEYLDTVQRDIYNDALQRAVSDFYRHPEMMTITQARMYDETMIDFYIDNSDCTFTFCTADGGNSWEYYCFNNVRGSDYNSFIIIFDHGVPDNADDLYEMCVREENTVDIDGEIWRTDYQTGDPVLSLRDAEDNTVKIPIS